MRLIRLFSKTFIENPVGDGLITHLVRKATNDGYQMALFGILVIIVGYGGLIFCLRNAVRVARDVKAKKISVEKVGKIRGVIEFAVLATFLIMNQIILIQKMKTSVKMEMMKVSLKILLKNILMIMMIMTENKIMMIKKVYN